MIMFVAGMADLSLATNVADESVIVWEEDGNQEDEDLETMFMEMMESQEPDNVQLPRRTQSGGNQKPLMDFLKNTTMIQTKMLSKLNEEPAKKRKREQEEDQEPDLRSPKEWKVDRTLHVVDDSVSQFCWSLRTAFRNPNSCPKTWWTADKVDSRISYPRRGCSLYVEHMSGSNR